MANPYINIYTGNPTAGAKDGILVSSDGSYSSPIEGILNKGQLETKTMKLAIRAEEGYTTAGNLTRIYTGNATDTDYAYQSFSALKLGWTENGEFKAVIETNETINSTNKIFYAQFSMSSDEMPMVDKSMKIAVAASLVEVS